MDIKHYTPSAEPIELEIREEETLLGNTEEKTYSVELIDFADKKVQIAMFLKRAYGFSDVDALQLVSAVPCFLLENQSASKVAPLLKKFDTLPVEYKLYTNGFWTLHKRKGDTTSKEYYKPLMRSKEKFLFSVVPHDKYMFMKKDEKQDKVVIHLHYHDVRIKKRTLGSRIISLLGWKWIFEKLFGR